MENDPRWPPPFMEFSINIFFFEPFPKGYYTKKMIFELAQFKNEINLFSETLFVKILSWRLWWTLDLFPTLPLISSDDWDRMMITEDTKKLT